MFRLYPMYPVRPFQIYMNDALHISVVSSTSEYEPEENFFLRVEGSVKKTPKVPTVRTKTFASQLSCLMRAQLYNHPSDESLQEIFSPSKPYTVQFPLITGSNTSRTVDVDSIMFMADVFPVVDGLIRLAATPQIV